MASMDILKAQLEKKRKVAEQEFGGKKYAKRSDVEAARLKKLREEEQKELEEKEKRRQQQDDHIRSAAAAKAKDANKLSKEDEELAREVLAPAEVVRRLRLLGQPATFFGEDDFDRMKRLRKAEADVQFDDEHTGGQQANTLLEMQRQTKKQRAEAAAAAQRKKEEAAAAAKEADGGDGQQEEEEPENETLAAFKRAAALVKEARQEERMPLEQRVHKYVERWLDEWEADVEVMPESYRQTQEGSQAVLQFKQTSTFLMPMLQQLKAHSLKPELVDGLWGMVNFMKQRNYLAAYDHYISMAIGNAPWPIGVTSVGIHERSAREKISHAMNQQSVAHIMTDESARRYLQGMKRLMTFVQRLYPTDPSKAVDYGLTKQPLGKVAAEQERLLQLEWKQGGS